MFFQFSSGNFFQPYFTFSGQDTLYQLARTHFKGKHSNSCWFACMQCCITGQVQCQCCFTDRWPRCKNDEICILPTVSNAIKRSIPSRYPSHILIFMAQVFNALNGFHQYGIDCIKIFAEVIVGYLKQFTLGVIEKVKHIGSVLIRVANNFSTDAYQLPLDELLENDPRVRLDICRGDYGVGELSDRVSSANHFQFFPASQFFHHC